MIKELIPEATRMADLTVRAKQAAATPENESLDQSLVEPDWRQHRSPFHSNQQFRPKLIAPHRQCGEEA